MRSFIQPFELEHDGRTYEKKNVCVCVCIHIYVCDYIYVCVCIHIYVYVYMCVCVCDWVTLLYSRN